MQLALIVRVHACCCLLLLVGCVQKESVDEVNEFRGRGGRPVLGDFVASWALVRHHAGEPADPRVVARIHRTAYPAPQAKEGQCAICFGDLRESAEDSDSEGSEGEGEGSHEGQGQPGSNSNSKNGDGAGTLVAAFPCNNGHIFHWTCLEQWLVRGNSCPLCQFKIKPATEVVNNAAWRMVVELLT